MKKINFSDKYGLTQAVLDGRKTMTRRIAHLSQHDADVLIGKIPTCPQSIVESIWLKSRYKVNEVVAIAQSYDSFYDDSCDPRMFPSGAGWTNKMFVKADLMPHHIKITGIKVERLQDISEEDCLKEGIYEDSGDDEFPPSIFYEFEGNEDDGFDTPREAFATLIDKVSGKGTWESNPYVFCYEFVLID